MYFIYFCKLVTLRAVVKINVSKFAFFELSWSPYSSKIQMRSVGLKMPFLDFSIFSPTPQNMSLGHGFPFSFLDIISTPY